MTKKEPKSKRRMYTDEDDAFRWILRIGLAVAAVAAFIAILRHQ